MLHPTASGPFRPPLLALAGTGKLHQNPSHQLGRDGKEMGAVLPINLTGIDQSKISLIDEGTGLQDVAGSLPGHVVVSQLVQLIVDEGDELLEGFGVPAAPGPKQLGNVMR